VRQPYAERRNTQDLFAGPTVVASYEVDRTAQPDWLILTALFLAILPAPAEIRAWH